MPAESIKLLSLSWQARGLYRLLKSHLSENGSLDLGDTGVAGLAVLLRADLSEIQPHVDELVRNGFWTITNNGQVSEIRDVHFCEEQRADESLSEMSENKKKNKKQEDKKNTAGRPASDPRHRPMVDLFFGLWLSVRGGDKYTVTGADAKAVQRFLKSHPVSMDEIERRMRFALGNPWFAQNGSLAMFCSKWGNFDKVIDIRSAAAGGIRPTPRPALMGLNPATGKYDLPL